jgi:hypothetical protein
MTKELRQVCLSARGLANIRTPDEINDFEFVVGDAHYRCPWFIAHFLSPRIAQLRSSDITINELIIDTKDPKREFPGLLSLGRGGSITIGNDNRTFYSELSAELLNEELLEFVEESCAELSCENVLTRLTRRIRFDFDCSHEIDFIASHLHEIDISNVKCIDFSILSRIFSSAQLKIKSEDWFYDVIWKFVEIDRNCFGLVEFVCFEFVSTSIAGRFISDGCDYLDLLDPNIWRSLGRRFIYDISPTGSNSRLAVCGRQFSPSGQSSLDGIISYLTAKCGGNVHDKGIVNITSSSLHGSTYLPNNAADLRNLAGSAYFHSANEANAWLCYDFAKREVTPTHYAVVSTASAGNNHPKSWCLEVSTNGRDWTEVHQCPPNNDLVGSNQVGMYAVTQSVQGRFVRLRQTGKNHLHQDYFTVCALELFGTLREP